MDSEGCLEILKRREENMKLSKMLIFDLVKKADWIKRTKELFECLQENQDGIFKFPLANFDTNFLQIIMFGQCCLFLHLASWERIPQEFQPLQLEISRYFS